MDAGDIAEMEARNAERSARLGIDPPITFDVLEKAGPGADPERLHPRAADVNRFWADLHAEAVAKGWVSS